MVIKIVFRYVEILDSSFALFPARPLRIPYPHAHAAYSIYLQWKFWILGIDNIGHQTDCWLNEANFRPFHTFLKRYERNKMLQHSQCSICLTSTSFFCSNSLSEKLGVRSWKKMQYSSQLIKIYRLIWRECITCKYWYLPATKTPSSGQTDDAMALWGEGDLKVLESFQTHATKVYMHSIRHWPRLW